MPSAVHQWLVLWIARMMVRDGYVLSAFDGPAPQGGVWNLLPVPPTIGGSRPDVLARKANGTRLAFGEAKTEADLHSLHTQQQLRNFAAELGRRDAVLYVGVPRSAAWSLDRALIRAGLMPSSRLVRLHVPDVLLEAADANP